jgi:hypothetical protein
VPRLLSFKELKTKYCGVEIFKLLSKAAFGLSPYAKFLAKVDYWACFFWISTSHLHHRGKNIPLMKNLERAQRVEMGKKS